MLTRLILAAVLGVPALLTNPKKELDIEKLKEEYDVVKDFKYNRAAVCKDGKWGYVNEVGKLVIPLRYEEAFDFADEFASVYLTYPLSYAGLYRKQGIIIDQQGNWFTAPDQCMRGGVEKLDDNSYKFYHYYEHMSEGYYVYYKDGAFKNFSGYNFNNPYYPKEFEHKRMSF